MPPPPMARRDPAEVALDELRPALEEVVAFARRRAEEEGQSAVPPSLRPLLKLQRLGTGSLRAVRSAVEADDGLRTAVAEQVEPDDPQLLPWMWLARSPGWDTLLESVLVTAAAEDRAAEREQAERSAQRKLQRLEAKHSRTADALALARREAGRLRQRLDQAVESAEQDRAALSELRAAAARQLDELSRNATRAQRAEETLGAERAQRRAMQTELEALRAELEALRAEGDGGRASQGTRLAAQGAAPESDLEALRSAVRRAAEVLGLFDDADEAGPTSSAHPGRAAVGSATARGPGTDRPGRRRLRAGRGLHTDTPAGVLDLLSRPDVVVLVDGYNLAKLRWPNLDVELQRRRLVSTLDELGRRTATTFDVIFDGAAVTVWRQAGTGHSRVRVSFSAEGVEADDDIIGQVSELDDDTGVLVVTNDRRVQDAVARLGATVVTSDLFGGLLA